MDPSVAPVRRAAEGVRGPPVPRTLARAIAVTDSPQDDAYHLAGDRLGKFVILSELGRGAMGVVYEAFQEDLKRKVALKVLPANITLDIRQVQRFHREAESVARLRHDNVIQIYEVGQIEGTHYFAMELVEGHPLDENFGRDRESVYRAAAIALEAARGLAHAHERGVIHRDVKPGNLLLDRGGRVVVTDFGLARLSDSASLTSTDAIVGTPKYMSPEQILPGTKPMDGRTDQYSLAATLYHVLTGRPPFQTPSVQSTIKAILEERPPSPRKFNKSIPHDLATIILRCLEKDPADRYASAAELAADLERFLEGERIKARPKGIAALALESVRRHRVIASLGAVAAVALVLLLLLGGSLQEEQKRGDLAEELARIQGEADLDLAVQRIEDMAARHPGHEGVAEARRGIYWRHALRGMEDPMVLRESVLADVERAGRQDTFWHLALLVELNQFDRLREGVRRLPDGSDLRRVFEARLALEGGEFEAVLTGIGAAPQAPDPPNLLSYYHLVKARAQRGIAAREADGGPEARAFLQSAKESLQQARESEAKASEAILRHQIEVEFKEVRTLLGESVQLTDLIADLDARLRATRSTLTQLWGFMTPVEAQVATQFVERILDIAGLQDQPLVAAELEREGQRRLEEGATGKERAVAGLLLAVARLRLGRIDQAILALEGAEDSLDDDPGLTPYVLWGQSLAYRAQDNLRRAVETAGNAVDFALTLDGAFPDLEPLFRHATLLVEEQRKRDPAAAGGMAEYFGGKLRAAGAAAWATELLARLSAAAAPAPPR